MKKNTKALLWVLAVFSVLAVGLYIGGCGDDGESADAGGGQAANPCDGKKAGDQCTGGFCIEKVGGGLECAKECTVVGIDEACGEGNGCYKIGTNKVCVKAGSKKVGEACGVANDCEAGAMCLQPEGGTMACFKVCAKKDECGANADCVDTEQGYSVCVAE